jgi:Arc/MetJ-type ribon-helix-helix transcriptional regulator
VAKQKTYTLTAEQAEVLESLVEAGDFDSVEEALDEAIDMLLVSDEEGLAELLPVMEQLAAEMREKGEDTKDIDKQIADLKAAIAAMAEVA